MASLQISREEMLKRIAHFNDLIPNDYKAMRGGDSVDQNMLTGFTLIGRITSKNPPAIAGDHGFTVAIQKVKPGYSVSLHSHKMVERPELFHPLRARTSASDPPGGRRLLL